MLISPCVVDWEYMCSLRGKNLDEAMSQDKERERHFYDDAPDIGDSLIQYTDVSVCLAEAAKTLTEPNRSRVAELSRIFFREEFDFPPDLEKNMKTDVIAGALSPETVQKLSRILDEINYPELDEFFENLPEELMNRLDIGSYPSEEVFSGYLRDWNMVFKFAIERKAGVLMCIE